MRALLLMFALALLLSACAAARVSWRPDEAEIVAWWCEDVAHGQPRRAEELQLIDGSDRMEKVAAWAMGDDIRGERRPPRMLAARIQRLPMLKNFFADGLVLLFDGGLVAPRPGLDAIERALVEPLVDAENQDRRALDAVLLALTDAPGRMQDVYLAAAVKARTELDQQQGGVRWQSPAKSAPATEPERVAPAAP